MLYEMDQYFLDKQYRRKLCKVIFYVSMKKSLLYWMRFRRPRTCWLVMNGTRAMFLTLWPCSVLSLGSTLPSGLSAFLNFVSLSLSLCLFVYLFFCPFFVLYNLIKFSYKSKTQKHIIT